MNQVQITARGYLWNHAGKMVEYILLFACSVLIARGLGVEGNGTYAALVTFAQLLLVVSSLSLETSLNRFIPQLGQQDRNAKFRYLLRRVLLGRILLFGIVTVLGLTAVRFLALSVPAPVVRFYWIIACYAGVRSLIAIMSMVFVAQLRAEVAAAINASARALELIGIGGMTMMGGMQIDHVMLFLIATGVLQFVLYLYAARTAVIGDEVPMNLRPFFAFGAIYWLNTILDYFLGRQGDILFLTALLSSSVPVSLYHVAFTIVLLAAQGMTMGLGGITLSSFSRLAVASPASMDRFYGFLVRVVSLLVLPLLVFIFFNARAIVAILFSDEFIGAALLVQGMILFRVLARMFAGAENAEYMLAKGHPVTIVAIGVAGAGVNIALDLLLIPRYEAMGAVIGSGCANLLVNMLGSLVVTRNAGHAMIQWKYWLTIAGAAGAAGALSSLVLPGETLIPLAGRALLFTGLVSVFLFAAKPFPEHDVHWVSGVNARMGDLFVRFTRSG